MRFRRWESEVKIQQAGFKRQHSEDEIQKLSFRKVDSEVKTQKDGIQRPGFRRQNSEVKIQKAGFRRLDSGFQAPGLLDFQTHLHFDRKRNCERNRQIRLQLNTSSPQPIRFPHISTPAIPLKHCIVQLHIRTICLDVQCDHLSTG